MMDKGKTSGMKELCLHNYNVITGKYGVLRYSCYHRVR